ncbi:MAG: hypothetical protein JO117_08565 [Verrucomicrobia bacterium]|nr:hypothetical protein [Verrucomicrobiota bacterium]
MTASIGWVATAAFAASYLCKNPGALRRVQALAACLWILYGCVVGALPVVVANLIVAVMAVVYPWFRDRLASRRESSASVADAASRESFRPAAEMHRAINQAHPTLEPLCYSTSSSWLPRPTTNPGATVISAGW